MSNTRYLDRANEILSLLATEGIESSPSDLIFRQTLSFARTAALQLANENWPNYYPALTAHTAVTLLGMGLCADLSQRMALEYVCRYKEKNISFVFTSRYSGEAQDEDHAFIFIGELDIPEELYVGQTSLSAAKPEKTNVTVEDFFTKHKNRGVIADPLLKCAGTTKEQLQPLFDYLAKYNITHIFGVKSYFASPHILQAVDNVKQHANELVKLMRKNIAETAKQHPFVHNHYLPILFQPKQGRQEKNKQPEVKQENNEALNKLIKKYGLSDCSQPSLEKGLRNAATNNQLDDVKIFLAEVKNINAVDANPKMARTALHWAAIKGHRECYGLLMQAGANDNIVDKDGQTPTDYLSSPSLRK